MFLKQYTLLVKCENITCRKLFFSVDFVNTTATLLNLCHLEVLYLKSTDWLLADLKNVGMD